MRRSATRSGGSAGTFLDAASRDRFHALWTLVATTGMRRSELAGAERDLLDLEGGTLTIAPTRVVVAGKPVDEDGKSESGRRTISLDPDTIEVLRKHLAMLDEERATWGPSYPDHGKLFCYEDGRRLHPDTITRRFNRLVDRAGLRRITLHGVRHSYVTVSIDAGINPKDPQRTHRTLRRRVHNADLRPALPRTRQGRRRNGGRAHRGGAKGRLTAGHTGRWSQNWSRRRENGPPDDL